MIRRPSPNAFLVPQLGAQSPHTEKQRVMEPESEGGDPSNQIIEDIARAQRRAFMSCFRR